MDDAPKAPTFHEIMQGVPRAAVKMAKRRFRPLYGGSGLGVVIDRDIPVVYCCVTRGAPLGMAHKLRARKQAVILVFFTSSTERIRRVRRLRYAAVCHRLLNPGHRIIFLCNTEKEAQLFGEAGETAIQINQNIFVSHQTFRPVKPQPVIYDAIYNARLIPVKRHDLSLRVKRCAFIYYHADQETPASDAALRNHHRRHAPDHTFVNPLEDGVPVPLLPQEVNDVYAQAAVGLCLSPIEGAMLASMEYMLAGLPIVSTPSVGGRDVFFDQDYCIIVEPNPRAVRDAVEVLKSRAIPRSFIASRTRKKVEQHRQRLIDLVDEIRINAGMPTRSLESLFDRQQILYWLRWEDYLADIQID